jgi:tetratricopeptide (TPR) repeat protein
MTANCKVAALLLVALFTGSVLARQKVEAARGKEATLEEVLYIPSAKALKRMSLGYSGLLASIYWTRAVQYFGAKHEAEFFGKNEPGSTRYDLLYPLLDITTDLDPNLIPAYQNGAIFLSLSGARQPDKAVALLEKGIRANPEYWRLYFTLGFIHYQDRHDFRAAEEAFEKGSEVPGALPWMKVMAARMAGHARDINTALVLWKGVYDMSFDKMVKETALEHVASLQADAGIEALEQQVQLYRQKTGSLPSNWSDLVHGGLLRGIPVDPTGEPFVLIADGTVSVKDPSKFPFLGEGREKTK